MHTLELRIYGDIDVGSPEGVSADAVVRQIKNATHAKTISVSINSAGGNMFSGIAIHNALKDHPARVTVKVDGLAASAASIIAMAGDTIEMGEGSFLMVHRAHGLAYGHRGDLRELADVLEKADGEIVSLYAGRTKKPLATVRGWVDAETWFTGQEAVEAGLADRIVQTPKALENAVRALAGAQHAVFNSARVPQILAKALEAHKKRPAAAVPAGADPAEMARLQAWHDRLVAEARIKERVEARQAAGVNPFLPKQGSAPDMSSNPFVPREDDTAIPPGVARFMPKDDGDDKVNPFLPKDVD
jgi:ATP-dependent protease ClpP protease subunit